MAAIMSALGTIVTGVTSMVSSWLDVIMAEGSELILFMVLFGFLGVGIGLLSRLMHL